MARPRTRPDHPTADYFKGLIRRTLRNYPNITVSMLGSHIRPYGKEWREVLEEMVKSGEVICDRPLVEGRVAFKYRLPDEPTQEEPQYAVSRAG